MPVALRSGWRQYPEQWYHCHIWPLELEFVVVLAVPCYSGLQPRSRGRYGTVLRQHIAEVLRWDNLDRRQHRQRLRTRRGRRSPSLHTNLSGSLAHNNATNSRRTTSATRPASHSSIAHTDGL